MLLALSCQMTASTTSDVMGLPATWGTGISVACNNFTSAIDAAGGLLAANEINAAWAFFSSRLNNSSSEGLPPVNKDTKRNSSKSLLRKRLRDISAYQITVTFRIRVDYYPLRPLDNYALITDIRRTIRLTSFHS